MTKCAVCETREAEKVCSVCGRPVCTEHFIEREGVCSICDITLCYICRKVPAIGVCMICGKPVCKVHSVRINLERLCLNCLQQVRTSQ